MAPQTQMEVALKLRDESFTSGLRRSSAELGKMGHSFRLIEGGAGKAFDKISHGAQAMGKNITRAAASMGDFDKTTARFAGKVASVTNRLLGLSIISQQIGDAFGQRGQLGQSLKAVTSGFTTFASVVSIMPNQFGLAAGAAAGLGVMLYGLVGISEEVRAALEKVQKQFASLNELRAGISSRRVGHHSASAIQSEVGQILGTERRGSTAQKAGIEAEIQLEIANLTQLKLKYEELDAARDQHGKHTFEQQLKLRKLSEEIQILTAKIKSLAHEAKALEIPAEAEAAIVQFTATLAELGKQSDGIEAQLQLGLISPLKAAEEQVRLTDEKLKALIKTKQHFSEEDFKKLEGIVGSDRPAQKKQVDDLKQLEKEQEALQKAAEETARAWQSVFDSMADGFSSAVAGMLVDGESFSASMKNVFKDLARNLVKTLLDSITGPLMKGIGSAFSGTLNTLGVAAPKSGGVNIAGTQQASGGGLSTGNLVGAGAGLGLAVGGMVAQQGYASGNMGKSIGGMALAGASVGAIAGPIGAIAGALIGAAAGAFLGSKSKKKKKKAKKKAYLAALAAEAERKRMLKKASKLIKMDVRSKLGGGLASTEATDEISKLFSNDLSEAEIMSFGPEQVVANEKAIQQLAAQVTNNIAVTANVQGAWDVQKLGEDLGGFIAGTIQSAGAQSF